MQDDESGSVANTAWEQLARAYWKPLYVFLRRKGQDHHSAADDIQGFFVHLLTREFLRKIERGGGLFRSFLITSLQHWRTDKYRKASSKKRGGGVPVLPLNEMEEESNLWQSLTDDSPEVAFDRRWARTVYDNALETLQERLKGRARESYFSRLGGLLTGQGAEPYRQIADELGTSEGAVRQAALELRKEFGAVLRLEVRRTVADNEQVDAEIRYLLGLLRG